MMFRERGFPMSTFAACASCGGGSIGHIMGLNDGLEKRKTQRPTEPIHVEVQKAGGSAREGVASTLRAQVLEQLTPHDLETIKKIDSLVVDFSHEGKLQRYHCRMKAEKGEDYRKGSEIDAQRYADPETRTLCTLFLDDKPVLDDGTPVGRGRAERMFKKMELFYNIRQQDERLTYLKKADRIIEEQGPEFAEKRSGGEKTEGERKAYINAILG